MTDKTKIIAVVGPTASGKTRLAIEIAKSIDGEIISADSMQVYKGMSIATAAPTEKEKKEVTHHLVEFLDCSHAFSVAEFSNLAEEKVREILEKGKVPVICGGTGLFIDSFLNNIKFAENKTDENFREELLKKSPDELYEMLLENDPEAAKKIHKNNVKRVARALEIYYSTGKNKTEQEKFSKSEPSPYEPFYIGINYKDRQKLYDRINLRVDKMVENGLIEEAEKMLPKCTETSCQAIGHKELKPYFDGVCSIETCVEKLKQETRRYAKRQITWFKRNEKINWFYADDYDHEDKLISSAISKAKDFLNEEN